MMYNTNLKSYNRWCIKFDSQTLNKRCLKQYDMKQASENLRLTNNHDHNKLETVIYKYLRACVIKIFTLFT